MEINPQIPPIQNPSINQQISETKPKMTSSLNKTSIIIIIVFTFLISILIISGSLIYKNYFKVDESIIQSDIQSESEPAEKHSHLINESIGDSANVKIVDATNSAVVKAFFKAILPTRNDLGNKVFKELAESDALLFIHKEPGRYIYWTKNLRVPIDLVWILGDEIVEVKDNLPPPASDIEDSYITKYTPSKAIDIGLELKSGSINKYGINVGDQVFIEK